MNKIIQFKIIYLFIAGILLIPTFTSAAVVSKSQPVDPNQNCTSGEFCKLIGYWTFDGNDVPNGLIKDMSATTTPSHGNTNSISTSTFYTAGKIGQALNFDGVDDGVTIGTIPALYASSSDMTISMWIKPSKLTVGALCLICNSNAGLGNVPWALEFNSTAARFSFGQAGLGAGTVRVTSSTNLKKDVWYHVVAVRTYSSSLSWPTTLYLNGVSDGSGTLGRAGLSNQVVAIGKYGAANSNYFQGAIDDVRVYNRALSVNEIKQLYNSGISKFGTSKFISSISTCKVGISCGLVQYWSFNGNDIQNGTVLDLSGNGNKGIFSGISTTTFYTAGKIGQALNFDGINDTLSTSATLDLTTTNIATISFWANILNFNSSDNLFFESSSNYSSNDGAVIFDPNSTLCSGRMSISIQDSVTTGKYRSECFNRPTTNTFHHYSVVYDNSTITGDVKLFIDGVEQVTQSTPDNTKDQSSSLGNFNWYFMSRAASSKYNSGIIDEVYIHKRALSSSEILMLYNQGMNKYAVSPSTIPTSSCFAGLSCGLVGYWTFDGKDMSNGRVIDKSPSGNSGNLMNISTSTFYAAGKVGQGFNFDGIDDRVSIDGINSTLSINNNFTISAWFKSNSFSTADDRPTILGSSVSTSNRTYVQVSSIGEPIVATWNGVSMNNKSGNPVKVGTWHHIVMTNNGTTVNGYIDNILMTGSVSANTSFSNNKTNIGSGPVFGFFPGIIDDVRIYNRVLSLAEINQLYNLGK